MILFKNRRGDSGLYTTKMRSGKQPKQFCYTQTRTERERERKRFPCQSPEKKTFGLSRRWKSSEDLFLKKAKDFVLKPN